MVHVFRKAPAEDGTAAVHTVKGETTIQFFLCQSVHAHSLDGFTLQLHDSAAQQLGNVPQDQRQDRTQSSGPWSSCQTAKELRINLDP